ncbi:hypothetical protein [Salinicoccus kekensis]|uniref:Tripartite-type tricarboxylate transporter receptor subunit TctC n=1 Tax=Salinicoccus kekensis TaxID=714307 RepID=A0A285U6W9_9STAP|nr:hypothetical protein [Salinicoccus kekensis]SOC37579.1 tripartite-type tricarboxylate transporter receptor subunit TctC [Salinicoccus kekensis]
MKKLFLMISIIFLCGALMALNPLTTNGSGEEEPAGHNLLTFVVPFEAGGGTDIFGRFFTPYFSDQLEGNPLVQVENIPGGASITGTNEYAQAKPKDGSHLLTSSASSHIPYMLDQSSVDYDFKGMKPIIGSPMGGVVYSTPEKAEQFKEDLTSFEEPLYYAGISPSGLDLVTLLSYEVLDLNFHGVLGYGGRGPSRVAFEQGESNLDYQTTSAYNNNVKPLVENGTAEPLYSLGQIDENGNLVRDPQFPELPTVEEVYIDQYGEAPTGEVWEAYKQMVNAAYTLNKVIWVHEDAPVESIARLQDGAEGIKQDADFIENAEVVLEGYEVLTGDALQKQIDEAFNVSDSSKNLIQAYLLEKYDLDITEL